MPSCQLHRPIEGPGSMDSAMFHEALAEQDGPYGPSNTGLSEHQGKYNLLRSPNISLGHKYLQRAPLSHEGVFAGNGKHTSGSAMTFPVSCAP